MLLVLNKTNHNIDFVAFDKDLGSANDIPALVPRDSSDEGSPLPFLFTLNNTIHATFALINTTSQENNVVGSGSGVINYLLQQKSDFNQYFSFHRIGSEYLMKLIQNIYFNNINFISFFIISIRKSIVFKIIPM